MVVVALHFPLEKCARQEKNEAIYTFQSDSKHLPIYVIILLVYPIRLPPSFLLSVFPSTKHAHDHVQTFTECESCKAKVVE